MLLLSLAETADIDADSIKVSAFSTNGTKGTNYTKDTAAKESTFSYSEGVVTLPTVEDGNFIIKFERKVKADTGARIVNRGDKFPSTVKLTLKMHLL